MVIASVDEPVRVNSTSTRERGWIRPPAAVASVICTETARLPGSMVDDSPSAPDALVSLAKVSGSLAVTGNSSTRSMACFSSSNTVLGRSFSAKPICLRSVLRILVPAPMSRAAATTLTVLACCGAWVFAYRNQVSSAADSHAAPKIMRILWRSID